MDRVTKVKRQVSLERWKSIITECRSSGEPVHKWCKENGICEQTYYKKLKLLREQELDKLPLLVILVPEDKPVVFKQLEVQAPLLHTQAAVLKQMFQVDFMDCERCVFVLAVDYDIIRYGVNEKYGKDFGESQDKQFFDKII